TAVANDAARAGDGPAAADALQVFAVQVLDRGGTFVNEMSYAELPQLVHRYRARGLYQQPGKVEQAMAELRLVLNNAPAHIEAVIDAVPELKKLGHPDAARELFDIVYKTL